VRRVTIAVTALAACALTPIATVSTAQAAAGQFTYTVTNVPHVLNDPADNQCYTLGNAQGQTTNATNADAQLYSGSSCKGSYVATLHLGHEMPDARFRSVRFVR
jgi:hypothetical protein